MQTQKVVALMAEDNEHDIVAARRAWKRLEINTPLFIVSNGEECLDYLNRKGKFADTLTYPRPHILLLDINLPKINGLKVLEIIRSHDKLKSLPVVMITTSKFEEDKEISSNFDVSAYIVKSVEFEEFVDSLQVIKGILNRID